MARTVKPAAEAAEAKTVKPAAEAAKSVYIPFEEYEIKKESIGGRFRGATVMKVIRITKIDEATAARLNLHAANSNIAYFPAGTYNVSDLIPVETMRSIAPGFNWGGKEKSEE